MQNRALLCLLRIAQHLQCQRPCYSTYIWFIEVRLQLISFIHRFNEPRLRFICYWHFNPEPRSYDKISYTIRGREIPTPSRIFTISGEWEYRSWDWQLSLLLFIFWTSASLILQQLIMQNKTRNWQRCWRCYCSQLYNSLSIIN